MHLCNGRLARLSPLLMSMALVLVLFAADGMAHIAVAQDSPFNGTWILDEEASDDFAEAFEPALQEMGRIRRSIARIALGRADGHAPFVHIEITDDYITVQQGERRPARLPANGEPVQHENDDGDIMQGTAHLEGNVLRVEMQGENGGSNTDYHLSDNHQRLTVHRTLESERLPEPVEILAVYNRD